MIGGKAQHIAYSCEISSVKNIAHRIVRYGKIKRNTYRRGTGAYRCSQSISEGRTILQNLQKSRQVKVKGSQKWVGIYNNLNKSSDKGWFKEKSRAPKNVHRKTNPEVEQLIIKVRKSLMEGKTKRHKVSVYRG